MATKKWKIEVQNVLNSWGSVHIFNDQNCTIATVFNTPHLGRRLMVTLK